MCEILVLLLSVSLAQSKSAGNVLLIDSVTSPSHQIWWHRFAHALADHGYNVTLLSCKMIDKPPKNLHPYHLHNLFDLVEDDFNDDNFNFLELSDMNIWTQYIFMNLYWIPFEKGALEAKGFREIMDFPEDFKFELILYDYFGAKVYLSLAERFPEAKLIGGSAYPGIEYTNRITKAPNLPSFVRSFYQNELKDTFCSRLESFLIYLVDEFVSKYHTAEAEKELRKAYTLKRSLSEISSSSVMSFANHHPALDSITPIMPEVIAVGGLQIEDPRPLPKDLEEIFSVPSKGVVLFSLGSNVPSETLGEARLNAITSALAELPEYTFLWKIDLSKLSLEMPKNVSIRSWLPQNDILADNRTKLFMSHAGGLSTQECTWHGQPMLALPVMMDQFPVSSADSTK